MALGSARSISDYRTPEGRPDVRGWPVVAEGGTRVGTVQDLLVDKDTRAIRYLEVDLDDRDDTVLVPWNMPGPTGRDTGSPCRDCSGTP